MRKIMVSGFLGADAQKQISKQNREYVTLRVANKEYNDPKGADGLTQTTWMRVTCFSPNLLSFASSLKKGSNVTIIGDLKLSTYQNKMGQIDIDVDVIADSICYTGGGDSDRNKNSHSNGGANSYTMSNNSNKNYGNTNVPSAPQVTMFTATSMPTAAPIVTPTVSTSTAGASVNVEDDDLPF